MTTTHEIGQTLISIKINGGQVKKGLACGIKKKLITVADQKKKRERDVKTAGSKAKAKRLGRVDTVGNQVFDGGNLLFLGRKKGKEEYLCPISTIYDMVKLGFHVSDISIVVKEGDKTGGFLRVQFSDSKPAVAVKNQKASEFIDTHMKRIYRATYGYINPPFGDDPINTTFNFSGPVLDDNELEDHANVVKDLRIISMQHPGHCSCKIME